MATINFNGLATGLDTKSIVDQLSQIKQSQLVTPVSNNISLTKAKKAAFSPINSSLTALRDAAKALNESSNAAYGAKTTESSNTAKVQITATDANTAVKGTYNITNITTLAQPERILFEGVANTGASTFGTGDISFTYKGVTSTVTIDTTNNTLDGIRTAINNKDMGITASIVNDGTTPNPYRLVLTSNVSGADTTITHDMASVLSLTEDAVSSSAANEPADAEFSVNSLVYHSHTNSVATAVPGVTFQLQGLETTDTITLTVKQNTAGIISKVQAFVSALNAGRDGLKKAISPDANNQFGPLGQDNLANDAYYQIGSIAATRIGTTSAYKSLAEIGITADRSGLFTVDTGKLTTVMDANPDNVRRIFQGTTLEDGIAEKMFNYLDKLTNPIGSIAVRQKQYDDSLNRLNKLLTERAKALQTYTKKLQTQFNNLEKAMSALKGQQDQLTSLTDQISGSGNS